MKDRTQDKPEALFPWSSGHHLKPSLYSSHTGSDPSPGPPVGWSILAPYLDESGWIYLFLPRRNTSHYWIVKSSSTQEVMTPRPLYWFRQDWYPVALPVGASKTHSSENKEPHEPEQNLRQWTWDEVITPTSQLPPWLSVLTTNQCQQSSFCNSILDKWVTGWATLAQYVALAWPVEVNGFVMWFLVR